jgi:hypothetical protein
MYIVRTSDITASCSVHSTFSIVQYLSEYLLPELGIDSFYLLVPMIDSPMTEKMASPIVFYKMFEFAIIQHSRATAPAGSPATAETLASSTPATAGKSTTAGKPTIAGTPPTAV